MELNIIIKVAIVHTNLKEKEQKKKSEPRNTSNIANVSETLLEIPGPSTKATCPRRFFPIAVKLLNQSFLL